MTAHHPASAITATTTIDPIATARPCRDPGPEAGPARSAVARQADPCPLPAIVCAFFEALHHQRGKGRRHVWAPTAERLGRLGQMCRHDRGGGLGLEWRNPGEHFVGHHAERVDVRPVIELALSSNLFRRHVRRRPNHCRRRRHRALGGFGGLERTGNAKIGQEGVRPGEQDVVGLDVAVDHALRVRVGQPVSHLTQNLHGFADRQRARPANPPAERFAVDIRHDVEEGVGGGARIEERKDVRMLEIGGRANFLDEAFAADGRHDRGVHDLERDLPVVPEIVAPGTRSPCRPRQARARCGIGRRARRRGALAPRTLGAGRIARSP